MVSQCFSKDNISINIAIFSYRECLYLNPDTFLQYQICNYFIIKLLFKAPCCEKRGFDAFSLE